MDSATFDRPRASIEVSQAYASSFDRRPWWLCWEVYLLLSIATFLRLYGIQTTEFDGDQVAIFRMAYDALHHGMLIATSNGASLGILNPPGIEYILMIPAALGADALWAAVMVAVLAIASVMLTYFFARNYYGRLTATFATLLYATAVLPVFYSRFIWQQNLLLFFVPLFIMLLFRGAVSRRGGWFAPALVLFGFLVQLHGSSTMLAAILLLAWVLAPATVRWRDVWLGVLLLFLIYAPYIWWEVSSNFSDVSILLNQSHQSSQVDNQALLFYLQFLGTYNDPFYPGAFFTVVAPFVGWVIYVMTGLLVLAVCLVGSIVFRISGRDGQVLSFPQGKVIRLWNGVRRWFGALRADPYCCGLLLLLIWQIVPLLYLSRHSIHLYPHYFIVLMPGPFLLIGFLLACCVNWLRQREHRWKLARMGLYGLVVLLVVALGTSSTVLVLDRTYGHFQDTRLSTPYYNEWGSLQAAFTQADQLAQSRHLQHIYVLSDAATMGVYSYFADHTHTPATVFGGDCAILPGANTGPVAILVTPYNPVGLTLLRQFASAMPVSQPQRLGGSPFWLFVVQPGTSQHTVLATFSGHLALQQAQLTTIDSDQWIVTGWQLLRSMPTEPRVTYTYDVTDLSLSTTQTIARPGVNEVGVEHSICNSTGWHTGDYIMLGLHVPPAIAAPGSVTIAVSASQARPVTLYLPLPAGGSLPAETASYLYPSSILNAEDGQQVTVGVSP